MKPDAPVLRALARRALSWPVRAPGQAFALALAILAVAIAGASRIEIDADVTTGLDSPAARALDRIRRELGAGEELFVLVEATDDRGIEHLMAYADALTADLRRDPAFAPRPTESLDLERLTTEVVPTVGAAYLSPAEARAWAAPTTAFLEARIAASLARATLPGLGTGDRLLELDPLGLAGPLLASLGSGGLPPTMASGAMRAPDGRAVLVATPVHGSSSDPASARAATAAAQRAIAAHAADPGAEYLACHVGGGHAVAEESERIVRRDLVITLSTSLILSLALVGYGFCVGFRGALYLGAPVVWGTAVGVGLQGWIQPGGRVPAMALACAGVLIGLGIDFAIHAVGEAAGRTRAELEQVWPTLARRLGLAALTSIGAFSAFGLAAQPALRAMGAIATAGLVACWAGALLLMPALLRTAPFRRLRARELGSAKVAGWAGRRPWQALGAVAAASLAASAAIAYSPPRVEDDLSRMHAQDSRPLLAQRRIAHHLGRAAEPLLLVLTAKSEDEAVEACHRLEPALRALRAEGAIAGHFSPAHLVPSREAQASAARECADLLATPADRTALSRALAAALDAQGLDSTHYQAYIAGWTESLGGGAAPVVPATLDASPLGPALRTVLRRSPEGATAMVVVIPATSLWDAHARSSLVGALASALAASGATGEVTGMHVIASEAAQLVARDMLDVAGATVGIVLVVLFLHFRRPMHVAIVIAPAALTTLWTAGLVAATGVRLNMMNLGVLPLVLAIGVDDGIHLVDHWLADGSRNAAAAIARTGTAVILTSVTTMASFGSLACSELAGLASVGWLVLFGVGAALAATLTVLPALLGLVERR